MALSVGTKNIKTVVFISGKGSNLKSLIKFSKLKKSPITIEILSKNFIKKFNGQILNIHPSLLPKYKGLNTHERAIKNKDIYSGCTVHLVTPKLDSGKIICQSKVKISKKDTPKTLANKILVQEHKLYPKAIMKIFNL